MSHDKNQRARPNFSKLVVKNSKALILFASRNSWLRVSCVIRIFLCEEYVTIMWTVRDPSESFCQLKHSQIILIRLNESFTLRWDSMKTSQITEEYGTVLIIAQRSQTSLQGWSYCLSTSLYPSQCRECDFFLKLKIRFKKRKMYYWRYYL